MAKPRPSDTKNVIADDLFGFFSLLALVSSAQSKYMRFSDKQKQTNTGKIQRENGNQRSQRTPRLADPLPKSSIFVDVLQGGSYNQG